MNTTGLHTSSCLPVTRRVGFTSTVVDHRSSNTPVHEHIQTHHRARACQDRLDPACKRLNPSKEKHFWRFLACKSQPSETRRLLAVFSAWRSPAEMQVQDGECQTNQTDPSARAAEPSRLAGAPSVSLVPGSTLSLDNRNAAVQPESPHQDQEHTWTRAMRLQADQHLMLASYSTSTSAHLGDRSSVPTSELVVERRFWQALILPLILGCIIFLVAIWTKQVSFALRHDTIMMIVILGTVFLSMSAMAFWLSQDPHMNNEDLVDTYSAPMQRCHRLEHAYDLPMSYGFRLHQHRCRRHNNNNNHTQQAHQVQHRNLDATKRPDISIVDCQPPDYQSALANSLPPLYSPIGPDKDAGCSDLLNASLLGSRQQYQYLTALDAAQPPSVSYATLDLDQAQNTNNLPPSYEDSTRSSKQTTI